MPLTAKQQGGGRGVLTYALVVLGVLLAAYGVLMGALYPAGGFFLVWVVMGALLVAAGYFKRARVPICVVFLVGLVGVGIVGVQIASTASAACPAGLDRLVVLGAGLDPDGSPSETLRYRLDAALEYLEENPETDCIVSGGKGSGELHTEADAMEAYLVAYGVDEGRIEKETESENTAENIRNSAGLISPDETVGSSRTTSICIAP